MRGEYPFLRTIRNQYEALRDDHDRLQLSSQQEREELQRELRQRVVERDELQEELRQRIAERDEQISDERWLGDLLLNRLRLRAPRLALRWLWAAVRQERR